MLANGHVITVLTRNPEAAARLGTPLKIITSLDEIRDDAPVDAIINLAGEPLANGLWTKRKRAKIITSRTQMLQDIHKLCTRLYVPPKTIVIASAIGWYGLRGDEKLTEQSPARPCFTHDVCSALEAEADKLKAFKCRVVKLRIGLVLGTEGGMLANLLVPFEYGLGGPIGSGEQWMSWIDLDDVIRLIIHALATDKLEGPVNAVAPNPVKNAGLAKALGSALQRPALIPMPAKPLEFALGDFARELLLAGQRILPEKALSTGFTFNAETIEEALAASLPVQKAAPEPRSRPVHNNIICEK